MRDARLAIPDGEAPRRPPLPHVRSPGHAAFFELDDDAVLALDHADPGEQGAGGELGGGCLSAYNDMADTVRRSEYLGRVREYVLVRARAELEAEGTIRELDVEAADHRERIKPLTVASIDDVRPIFYQEAR